MERTYPHQPADGTAMDRLRPLVALGLAVTALGLTAGPASAACAGSYTPPAANNLPVVKAATLCLLNERRAQAGFPPLAGNAALDDAATRFSLRMIAERFFAHVAPDGASPIDRLMAAGLRLNGGWSIGENLGYGANGRGAPVSMVQLWMDSSGHRANILNGDYQAVGIGIVIGMPSGPPSTGATYTTDFAGGGSLTTAPKKAHRKKKHKRKRRRRKAHRHHRRAHS